MHMAAGASGFTWWSQTAGRSVHTLSACCVHGSMLGAGTLTMAGEDGDVYLGPICAGPLVHWLCGGRRGHPGAGSGLRNSAAHRRVCRCGGRGWAMGHVLPVADRSCVHAQRLRLGCGCTGRGQECRGREPDIPMGPSLTALGKPMEVARERLFWAILLPNCWFRLLSSSLETLLSRKKTTGPVRGLGQRINP